MNRLLSYQHAKKENGQIDRQTDKQMDRWQMAFELYIVDDITVFVFPPIAFSFGFEM